MDDNAIKELVKQAFENAGKDVDVLYLVKDEVILSPVEAEETAHKVGAEVVTFYRDPEVRKLLGKNMNLKQVVFATDFLKLVKAQKFTIPQGVLFNEYLAYAKSKSIKAISRAMFDFIHEKVFATTRPVNPGQKDTIFTWKDGIVEAAFIRMYEQGIVWQYMDNIVFTCPTHTELANVDLRDLFAMFFVEQGK